MDDGQIEVLSAVLTGLVLGQNSKPIALQTCTLLKKVVDNALKPDEKFKRLPGTNQAVKEKIRDIVGGSEFLDAIGFVREASTNDLILQHPNEELLSTASILLDGVIHDLQSEVSSSTTPTNNNTTSSSLSSLSNETDQEYLERKKIADQRAAEFKLQAEENRKKQELLRKQMLLDQKEVHLKQVVASVRQEYKRAENNNSGGGTAVGGGKIPYINTDSELSTIISSNKKVLVNLSASWCQPCKAIQPAVDELAKQNPDVIIVRVDVDDNPESASKYQVTAIPTFILFKNGVQAGMVRGANLSGVKQLISS
jgi:thioredoxin 1